LEKNANSKLKSSSSESDQTLQDDNKPSGRRYFFFFPFHTRTSDTEFQTFLQLDVNFRMYI
jgi:hypothetical protein